MIYPVTFAHPFAPGEYQNPLPDLPNSQVNVKARHADGSCKHAKFYIVMDGDPGPGQMTFGNAPFEAVNNTGMTPAQMLAACPDIELQLWDQNFTTLNHSVLLRNMIGNFTTVNASGPICTDVTVHDPAGSVDGTFGADGIFSPTGAKTVRPVWYIKFWPTINRVHVTLAVETGSTTCIQESWYATRILVNGTKIYEHPWDVHPQAKKWFWKTWIGDPVGEVAINHNLAHLAQSKALPNYDTSFQLQSAAIASMKQAYAAAPLSDIRSLRNGENSGMLPDAMSVAGTRRDLGVAAEWVIDALYSGDKQLYDMTIEEAERACFYPCFYRETYSGLKGFGNAPRVDDRPKSDFLQAGKFADGFEITGDANHSTDGWGWSITDRQHAPNPFYVPYLISGEAHLLDCLIQWTGFWVGVTNGADTDNRGRGPTGAEGVIGLPGGYGTRGPAHIIKQTAEAAWIIPDDSQYKSYFNTCLLNTIAAFEGTHGITGTALDSNPCKAWAASVDDNVNPLAWWAKSWANAPVVDASFKTGAVLATVAHWENSYMVFGLSVCRDLGFPVDALLAWQTTAWRKFAQAAMPGPLCLGLFPPTWIPAVGTDSQLFSDPAQIVACFVDTYDWQGSFYNNFNSDKNHGYAVLAVMAAACLNDAVVWNWYGPNAYDKTDWTGNPHWAIKPRA